MSPTSPDPQNIQRIAFINFGGIGDAILFAPVIEEIKQHLPQAHITLILEDRSRAVRDLLPHVDTFIEVDIQRQPRWKSFLQLWGILRRKYYDVVISSGSNSLIPVLLFLSGIPMRVGFATGKNSRRFLTVEAPLAPAHDRKGYAAEMYFALAESFLRWLLKDRYTPTHPVLPKLKAPTLEDLHWAKSYLKPDEPEQKILIHPGVSTISIQKNILKSWAPKAWAELITKLTQQGYQVYLVGGPDDKAAIEDIRRALPAKLSGFHNLYGQTKNLRQLAALVKISDLLIGVDSSPMHLAVGLGRPALTLFGPTDEKKLMPQNDPRFVAVSVENLSCRPCLWDVRNESCDKPVCLDIPVESVLHAVEQMLAQSPQQTS